MSNLLGALVCLKQVVTHPQNQDKRVRYQLVQSVHPIHLPDAIFNKIIQKFVKPGHAYSGGKCYSRAITGEPICAIVITDKEPWVVAITRSVKVEWPAYDISAETVLNRLINFRNIYEGYSSPGRIDLTDVNKATRQQAKNRSPDEPQILRNTEGRDFLTFPLIGKTLSFKNGFRIQILNKGKSGIRPLSLESEKQYRQRVQDIFTADTLSKLWQVYSEIEKDPTLYEKYIKGDIVGEPVDHQHPLAIYKSTLWKEDFSGWYVERGHVPGILPVNTDGQVYQRQTRLNIPAPTSGTRLLYKHEIPSLAISKQLLENTKK